MNITPRALRLASQLGFDPETLAAQALDMGLRTIDFNLAHDCHPFDCAAVEGFDISSTMDSMSPRALAKLESDGDRAQAVLLKLHCEANGLEY